MRASSEALRATSPVIPIIFFDEAPPAVPKSRDKKKLSGERKAAYDRVIARQGARLESAQRARRAKRRRFQAPRPSRGRQLIEHCYLAVVGFLVVGYFASTMGLEQRRPHFRRCRDFTPARGNPSLISSRLMRVHSRLLIFVLEFLVGRWSPQPTSGHASC
jgi:hypothetical protein